MIPLSVIEPEDEEDEPIERLPPHDIETEKHLLAAVIELPENLALVLGHLDPRDFYNERNRRIFEAVTALASDGKGVDYVALGGWLRDAGRLEQVGFQYLNDLAFLPAIGNIEEKAARVTNLARARVMIGTAQRIAANGYTVTADGAQGYLDEASRAIVELAQARGERSEIAPMASAVMEAAQRMLAAEARDGAVELPTGLAGLDKAIGGLGRQRVTVFAARPAMGKTALAARIAENLAAQGELVAFFSIEMPRWQLALRMACSRVGASAYRAMNGWLTDRERVLVFGAIDELTTLPLWIDETPTASLLQIRAKARIVETKAKRKLAAIFVDYLQLMRAPRDRGVTRDEQLSEITAGFKRLAKEMDCAVVYLSQLNREVEKRADKHPMLSDLRESGGIEQDADDIIFIYRPEYYEKQKTKEEDRGVAELVIAKQRNGPTDTIRVRFNAASVAFGNL